MVEYYSAKAYIQCGTTIKEKIVRVDAIINALMDAALKSASNDNITQYSLDDGQTKIHTIYKGTDSVYKSIDAFEKLKQMYINLLNKTYNGSIVRLVDSKNFNGGRNGRF